MRTDRLDNRAFLFLLALLFAFPIHLSADCWTLTYGGVNGDPNDTGAYATYSSTTYRLNGNEVYAYTTTGVYGPNAGLVITNVFGTFYRNSQIVWNQGSSQWYGGTIQVKFWQYLYSNQQYYLGSFQTGNTVNYPYNMNRHWGSSPYCTNLGYPSNWVTYYDTSNIYTAVKPTLRGPDPNNPGQVRMWYLGGASSIDGYYVTALLTGYANWGSSPPLYWTVYGNPQGGQASVNASIANQVLLTSHAPSTPSPFTYNFDVTVVGSTDGLPSDPLPVNINAPWQVFGYLSFQGSYNNSGTGYQSDYSYILYDTAGFAITVPITLHETLENCLPYSGSNWCTYTEHPGTWPPSYWSSGQFVDQYSAQVGQGLSPSPIVPQTPLGSTKALDNTQKFFVGSPGDPNNVLNIFTGMCVQRNRLQMYQDHGVKDIATSPVASGLCAQGQFVN